MKDVGTLMVAVQAAEDALPLTEHNLAQVPLAVLVQAAFATEEGTHATILPVCAVPGVDGDQLLNPVKAEGRVGTGVDVSTHPLVLDEAGASSLRLVAAACDDLLLNLTVVGVAGDMSTAHGANGDVMLTVATGAMWSLLLRETMQSRAQRILVGRTTVLASPRVARAAAAARPSGVLTTGLAPRVTTRSRARRTTLLLSTMWEAISTWPTEGMVAGMPMATVRRMEPLELQRTTHLNA